MSDLTEDQAPVYAAALRKATSFGELAAVLEDPRWSLLVPDAKMLVGGLTIEESRAELLQAIKAARIKAKARWVNEVAGPILIPEVLMYLSHLSSTYCVPWWVARDRAIMVGTLVRRSMPVDGYYLDVEAR